MQENKRTEAAVSDEANPVMIFDTLNAHQQSAALRGAIELDLFTAIAKGHDRVVDLAQQCAADVRGVRILCDFLVVHGFLTKRDGRYGLTPVSAKFLDRRSPQYLGSIAAFINSDHQLNAFRNVAELVRRGTTLLDGSGTVEAEFDGWVEFARSMVPMMMPAAEFIGSLAANLSRGSVRVLDIAAGHGMFGIEVARQNPGASVVALDWPNVLQVAQEHADAAGVADRYTVLAGDALSVDFGTGFDLVLVTNFFHHFDRDTCESLMRKVSGCLSEEGHVITLEFVPREDRVSPPVPAKFAFTLLATTPSGDAYTFAEYSAMWQAAGLASSELIEVPNSPQNVIVTKR